MRSPEYKARDAAKHKKQREQRRMLGLCSLCDSAPIPGRRLCEHHVALVRDRFRGDPEKHRADNRASFAKNKAARLQQHKESYYRDLGLTREQHNAWKRQYRQKNLHRVRAIVAEHLRRRRRMIGFHTVEQWLSRVAYWGWRCRYCHCELTDKTLTKDHVIAVAKGGTDWASNLVPACGPCNARKGNRHFSRFVQP